MPDLFIQPGKLSGKLNVPPSKSMAHRAIICSAIAGDINLAGCFDKETSNDILATIKAITALLSGEKELFCNESGSTLRFLIPLAAALGKEVTFTGAGRLPNRPLTEYQDILNGKGVVLTFPKEGTLPLKIKGRLQAGEFLVPGDVSSQYVTGLLMALPLLDGDSKVVITSELESAAYVDMTIRVMQHFGVRIERLVNGYFVNGNQSYLKTPFKVEGDYSQAAFWMVANYLGGSIKLSGLESSSAQGDKEIIPILKEYQELRTEHDKDPRDHARQYWSSIVGKKEEMPVFEIDASQIPDLIPILSIAAANTNAITKIVHAKRLRFKESDRLKTTAQLIQNIGGQVVETSDGLIIHGGIQLTGGVVDSFGDHRIAMAAAIAALSTKNGITIRNYDCVDKSYPTFFDEFRRMGGRFHELDMGK